MRRKTIYMFVQVIVLLMMATAWAGEEGLVTHYTFDEGSGFSVQDVSGNKNHGAIHGTQFVKNGNGYALQFDGIDDYVDCGSPESLSINDVISVEAWVYVESLPSKGRMVILGKDGSPYLLTYGKEGFYFCISGGINTKGPVPFTPNVWHHITATFDGTTIKIYIDGREAVDEPSRVKTIEENRGKVFRIGAYEKSLFFKGKIDEVKIYHRVLTLEEVKRHAKAPLPPRTLPAEKDRIDTTRGLVGHYTFGPDSETTLRDMSGHGNDGKTNGARLVKGTKGTALYFEGQNHVSFGNPADFKFGKEVTLTAWVYMTDIPKGDHALIVGRRPRGFGLVEHVNEPYVSFYTTGWEEDYCSVVMGRFDWHHVVAVFNGTAVNLYVDGVLGRTKTPTTLNQVDNSGNFSIGGFNYKGLIAEVKVYNRILSDVEIRADAQNTPGLTDEEINVFLKKQEPPPSYELRAKVCTLYFDRRVDVVVDLSQFPELPSQTKLEIELRNLAEKDVLDKRVFNNLIAGGEVSTSFKGLKLESGRYEVRSNLVGVAKSGAKTSVVDAFTWPEMPSWPKQIPEMKVLNNLVIELLNVDSPTGNRYEFTNPRDTNLGGGWVFISFTVDPGATGTVWLSIDSDKESDAIILHGSSRNLTQEAMRHLAAGRHKIMIGRGGNVALKKLIVRSIPELSYYRWELHSQVSGYRRYTWDFLEKYVNPQLNAMNASVYEKSWTSPAQNPVMGPVGYERQHELMRQWKAKGKRWLDELQIIQSEPGNPLTEDKAYNYWANTPAYQDPLSDGTYVNEWGNVSPEDWVVWRAAIRKIHNNFPGKVFYPHCNWKWPSSVEIQEAIRVLMDCGFAISWERYFPEPSTEYKARELVWEGLKTEIQKWKTSVPGCEKNIQITFGHLFSAIPETLNTYAGSDFKVYMDMQFNLVANDPEFFGLYGFMLFNSQKSDEEFLHWGMKLYRHYCIEGKTNMLSDDPYMLPHIKNPEFDEGSEKWTFNPAEDGNMRVKFMDGYGTLQGRWYGTLLLPDYGNHVLWTKRSAKGPNTFSQEIRNLEPGRLYSIKMLSGNYQDLSKGERHAVSIHIDNAELIPDKTFQSVVRQYLRSGFGCDPGANRPAWFNYHMNVFRAKGETAMLTISDWVSDKEPGGPIGQELIYNFIELQPFFLEETD